MVWMADRRLLCSVVLGALAIAGCQRQAAEPAVATVNGQAVPKALFDQYVRTRLHRDPATLDGDARKSALNGLLALESAGGGEVASLPADVQQELALRRLEYVARQSAEAAGALGDPTDAEVQQAYLSFVAEHPSVEFHVAHVLVPLEEQAVQAIAKLKAGAAFGEVAKILSADESKVRGGDIGWVSTGTLPAEFMTAVQELRVGEYSAAPVKTAYGWHVIKVLESRPKSAPLLESVRAQLVSNLREKRYQKFLMERLAAGRVEIAK